MIHFFNEIFFVWRFSSSMNIIIITITHSSPSLSLFVNHNFIHFHFNSLPLLTFHHHVQSVHTKKPISSSAPVFSSELISSSSQIQNGIVHSSGEWRALLSLYDDLLETCTPNTVISRCVCVISGSEQKNNNPYRTFHSFFMCMNTSWNVLVLSIHPKDGQ